MMSHLHVRSIGSRPGFSLVELLMAIFILGIGIISIATLFPAGIAQQRKAMDDQVGPLVARNAMSLLRSRIPSGSFGHVEINSLNPPPWDIQPGDWPWFRPALVVETTSSGPSLGAIDIFNTHEYYNLSGSVNTVTEDTTDPWLASAMTTYSGIPYAGHQNGVAPPLAIIEQGERQYPRQDGSGHAPRYYWDCMFRRAGNKVYAAIFVYRVQSMQGNQPPWFVQPSDDGQLQMPWMLDLESDDNDYGPWLVGQGAGAPEDRGQWMLQNAMANSSYDPESNNDCWQCPGQWLLDQNGNINRVAIGRTRKDDPTTHVELERSVPPLAEDSVHIAEQNVLGFGYTEENRVPMTGSVILPAGARSHPNFTYTRGMIVPDPDNQNLVVGGPVVSRIWYLPGSMQTDDGDEWSFTPIYILVEEF